MEESATQGALGYIVGPFPAQKAKKSGDKRLQLRVHSVRTNLYFFFLFGIGSSVARTMRFHPRWTMKNVVRWAKHFLSPIAPWTGFRPPCKKNANQFLYSNTRAQFQRKVTYWYSTKWIINTQRASTMFIASVIWRSPLFLTSTLWRHRMRFPLSPVTIIVRINGPFGYDFRFSAVKCLTRLKIVRVRQPS